MFLIQSVTPSVHQVSDRQFDDRIVTTSRTLTKHTYVIPQTQSGESTGTLKEKKIKLFDRVSSLD